MYYIINSFDYSTNRSFFYRNVLNYRSLTGFQSLSLKLFQFWYFESNYEYNDIKIFLKRSRITVEWLQYPETLPTLTTVIWFFIYFFIILQYTLFHCYKQLQLLHTVTKKAIQFHDITRNRLQYDFNSGPKQELPYSYINLNFFPTVNVQVTVLAVLGQNLSENDQLQMSN